jgi:O-antigen/teichoic acid export membrane protein
VHITPRQSFKRKFFHLAGGSAAAQALSLLLVPVLSRLYSPDEFGLFALYFAFSTVIGLLSTLRFEQGIVIAEFPDEAKGLVYLSLALSTLIGLGTLFFGFAAWLLGLIGPAAESLIVPIALSVTATGTIQTLVNWTSRHQRFDYLGFRNVAERFLVIGSGILFGVIGFTRFGLIYAQIIGLCVSIGYLGFKALGFDSSERASFRRVIRKYADFPKRNFFSTALSVGSSQIMAFLFGTFYLKQDLGQYSLANRIFEAPVTLLGNSFSTVYYQEMSQREAGDQKRLFVKSLRTMGVGIAVPILLVGFAGPYLFQTIFGESWRLAGEMARWLCVLSCFRVLFVSQASLLLVKRQLHLDLLISFLLFVGQIISFAIGKWYADSILVTIEIMSLSGALVYLMGLTIIYSLLNRQMTSNPA